MRIFIAFLLAYLLGSLSAATIIGRLFFKIDIKTIGSGNAGTTNAIRAFGKKAGIGVFVFDCLKGFIGAWLGQIIAGPYGSYAGAAGAILGHTFPIYFSFKGGKGIATAAGILFFLDLKMIVILLIIFALIVITTRYVSLGSIIVVLMAPVYTYIYHYSSRPVYFYLIFFLAAMILFNHRSNIKRLFKGEENKIGGSK